MSIAQISPNSVNADPVYVNPKVKADQAQSVPQVNQDAQKATQSIKTDTVTISQLALQKLASDGDTSAQEYKEKGGEKASEKTRGKD